MIFVRTMIGSLMVYHGAMHMLLWLPRARQEALVPALVVAALFVVAGIGVIFVRPWWRLLTAAAAIASLALALLSAPAVLLPAVVIDLTLLAVLLWAYYRWRHNSLARGAVA